MFGFPDRRDAYEILSDGSVQTYEKTVDIPYYDNVKPVWNDEANEK